MTNNDHEKTSIIDKFLINRLISILTNFILGLIKIFAPKSLDEIDLPKPKRKKVFPWRKTDDK